ncbi:MAG: putative phage tail protein [Peptococcaceae bacterium]|nr:putative phage tail protein [Peptococcaceae bacterium]
MSTSKDNLLRKLHKVFRKDAWINALFDVIGWLFDTAIADLDKAQAEFFVDTAVDMLESYERHLGISGVNKSLEDRRAAIIAGRQRGGKVDIAQIQAAANAWKNGATSVDFVGGQIVITFVSELGIPTDMEGLRAAISTIIPAHLAIGYIFRYLLIEEVHGVMTLEEMEHTTLDKFAF